MDKIDKKIIDELMFDSSRSITQLAKYLAIPRTTLKNRINRLENDGVIKGYKATIDWEKLGYPLCNFLHLSVTRGKTTGPTEIAQHLAKQKVILEVHEITGRGDVIAKIRMKHISDIIDLLENKNYGLVKIHPSFKSESTLVVKTYKEQ